MKKLWIGLDVGTTAIKAAAFRPDGVSIAHAERPTTVLRPASGAAEQDINAVWETAAACLKDLAGKCDGAAFSSLGICAQGDGFWPLDADGAPVRNAILWSDTRRGIVTDLETLAANGGTAAVGRGCHTDLWPGTSGMGWRWLRKAEPENAAKTAHVLTCGDVIGLRLTGEIATDHANSSIPFLDFETGAYGDALRGLDCEDLRSRLATPRPAREMLGRVTSDAARQTGLPEGLPVSVATLDLGAMIVGLGMSKPGETMMILGTTAVVNILTDSVTPTDTPVAASTRHSTGDAIIRILAPSTGAAAFDWFSSLHPQSLSGSSAAEIAGKLNALVETVPVGANGVTFLPYLNGERAPFVAPGLRAGFLGMSAGTTRGELGRAVMEGAALSMRHCFMSEGGLPVRPVQLTGGGARNPVWCQIIADVIGQDVLVNPAVDLGLWGAACLGAAAESGEDPIRLAAREENITRYESDAARHAAYGPVYARYELLSNAMQALQPKLDAIREDEA